MLVNSSSENAEDDARDTSVTVRWADERDASSGTLGSITHKHELYEHFAQFNLYHFLFTLSLSLFGAKATDRVNK